MRPAGCASWCMPRPGRLPNQTYELNRADEWGRCYGMQQRSGCVSDRGRRESRRDEATCAAEQVKPERLDFRIWFSKFVALQAFGEPRVHCLVSELLACRGVQTRRRHACATPCWSHAELTSQRLRHRSCVGAGQRTGQSSLGLFVSPKRMHVRGRRAVPIAWSCRCV